nr:MAG TPA: chromosome segregation ATPase [Caudoviricetes sp.]
MNLFNLFGTGNDLNTGSFVTLNGKEWRESITDFRKAFSEANDIGVTKKGTLFSWLTGNFNNDYDFVKDLDADTEALKKFKDAYTNESSPTFKKKNESFDATLKNSSVILQDFVNHTDDASISVKNFFSSVTGAGKLTNALKGIGLQMLTTAAQAAAIWAITEGFKLLVNWVDKLYRSGEIAKEKMEESKKTYQDTTDEIKSLNDELEENKKRIAEINGQDVITYTDKQELEKLETANTRLERQIQLKEHLAEMQAKEAVNDAVNSFNENYGEDYFGDRFDLDKKGPTDFINYKGLFDSIHPDEFGDKILERSNDIREYSAAIDYLNDKIDKYNQMAAVAATPDEEQTWLKQAELYQTQLEKINQGILDQAEDLETYKETLDLVGFDNLTSTQKKIYNQIEDALKYNYMKTDPASWFEQNFNDSKYADVASKLKDAPESSAKALSALKTQADDSKKSLAEMLDVAGNFSDIASGVDDYRQALKEASEAEEAVTGTAEKYGNVSNKNRQIIQWTAENLKNYSDFVKEQKEPFEEGSFSTVVGSSNAFDVGDDHELEIAYTPILQTDDGARPLTSNVLENYIYDLIQKAGENGPWKSEDLLKLDAQGLDEEIDGQTVHIKNMLAAVEGQILNGAELTAADVAAIAGSTAEEIAKDWDGATSEYAGKSMHDLQIPLAKTAEAAEIFNTLKDKADAAGVSLETLFAMADNDAFNDLFSGNIDIEALKEFIQQMEDTGFTIEDVINELESLSKAGVEANSVTIDADTAVKNVTTTISAVTAALQAQTTGVGVTVENFKALTDADKDYADCLEYVNGTMQINTEKAKELTDKKIEEAKATVRVARSQAQLKYAENKQELSRLNDALKKNNDLNEEQQSTLKEAISNREQENKKLREQCQNYEVLYSQLVQVSGAYQDWLNAQNATEAGTMYDDAIKAYDAIKDALESGKIGTQKYKAAIEFLVPKSVDENAVQQYVDTLKKYLTDDSKGITNFLNDAVKAGLMEEDSSGYVAIAGEKTIQDFCDAMKLTPEMVRAIFGELQEYGFDWEWDDAFFGETLTSLEMQADELKEKMDSVKPDSDSYKEWNDQLEKVNEKIENIKGNIDNTDVDALVDAYEKAKDAVDQMNSQGGTFDGQAEELQSALDKAADNLNKNGRVQLWIDASEAEKTVDDLTQRFNSGDFSVATELEAAQDKLADLNTQKEKLGAPTEVEIQVYAKGLEDAGKSTEEITQTLKDAKILNVETDDSEDKLSQTHDTVTDIANMLLTPYTLDVNTTEAMTKLGTVRELMNQISETTITAPVPSVPKSYAERNTTGTTGTGSANAAGTNGGLTRAERALVGELGYEVVVNPHSGKWYTVGEHGAEFVNLPKDAIVFDHKKSEELLKNGFVGARGMAMAEGNAYALTSGTITGGGYIPKNNPATSTTFQKNAKAATATAAATEAAQKNLERIEAEADAVKEAYEAQKKALEKQKKELESIKDSLESEQKILDGIVKTVTARIDKEIDRLEHQWDDLKEQLEDEKNNLDAAMNGATYLIEKRTKALQKEQEALEDSYQPRIDALQDELDKLNETNDAQEKAIELARKKAAMDAAKANRNVRVYREGKGFVWEADESEVKSTEEDYNDALRQKEHEDAQKALEDQKAALEKELEDKKQELQDKIDAYDEYKDKLSEGQNEYTNSKNVAILRQLYGANADQMILNMDQAMIDKITTDYMNNMSNTDHVENQIKENQKLIDQLEDYKSKWEEVADAYETEQNRINTVARLGADWEEKILGQRTDVLDDFKNHYIDILRQIEEKTAEINDLSLKIEVVEEEYQTKSDELDKEKKAAQAEVKTTKSSSTSSHATGIMNVAAFERARVDEAGPEIVVRQPEAGRYTSLEVGDGVVPGNLTRRLFSAAINPEAFVESAILKRMGNVNAELTSAGSSGVHIGDINIVMNGVNDVENFGRILHQNIGSIMAQEFSKR